jgi:hypothetical protein
MRDVNSYQGEGIGRNWVGTCPASPALCVGSLPALYHAGFRVCRPRSKPKAEHAGPRSLTYSFSDTFFIRETEATSVLFGSRLSEISIR